MSDSELLKNIFTAQVLMLAAQMKRHQKEKGVTSTSDFISEAVKEILKKQPEIMRLVQRQ